ncbi:RCC1 domain-containing protein [Streptomyces olivochromogenes]|uniref:RCC1 domain-containing protein n=1 Tax=Streptomyces olivochromogenes TaxID=1963 RepID=UPI001F3E3792|nr:hypothetical protein [Streptomyces olivochromogenes]MCF3132750.1 hypothetical protein [Streptomyces olivochromogenes]
MGDARLGRRHLRTGHHPWGSDRYDSTVVPPAAKADVDAIAAGQFFNLALKNGAVIGWGDNRYGQTDVPEAAHTGVTAIAAGAYHALALTDEGKVIAWGDNRNKQTDIPAAVTNGVVTAIAAGKDFSAAVVGGRVYAWGAKLAAISVPANAQSKVTEVSGGYDHLVALRDNGQTVQWQVNPYSLLTVPAAVGTKVQAISAGAYHTLALRGDPPPTAH